METNSMHPGRRQALKQTLILAAASPLAAVPGFSLAQKSAWPNRPVSLVAPIAPGGATDAAARVVAQAMTKALSTPVIVENRPGANGNVGATFAARSAPDGYTLLFGQPGILATNQFLYESIAFNPQRDFRPLSLVARVPNVIVAHPSLGFNTLADLVSYARANPGKLDAATPGSGSSVHLLLEMFKKMTDTSIMHVPYNGTAPALRDVLPGRVKLQFDNISQLLPYIRDGRLKALAVSTAERSPELPDVPTVAQALPGLDTSTWSDTASFFLIVAPAALPDALAERISQAIQAAVAQPDVQKSLKSMVLIPIGSNPQDARAFLDKEVKLWKPIIQSLGLKLD